MFEREQGGFDVVLGNPPWERIKLQEKEFFAARHPAVANARNSAERQQMIRELADGLVPWGTSQLQVQLADLGRCRAAS